MSRATRREYLRSAHDEAVFILRSRAEVLTGSASIVLYRAIRYLEHADFYNRYLTAFGNSSVDQLLALEKDGQ